MSKYTFSGSIINYDDIKIYKLMQLLIFVKICVNEIYLALDLYNKVIWLLFWLIRSHICRSAISWVENIESKVINRWIHILFIHTYGIRFNFLNRNIWMCCYKIKRNLYFHNYISWYLNSCLILECEVWFLRNTIII